MSSVPVLQTAGLTKRFGAFCAVEGVDLEVRAGEIHALVGPNGAGKTTLFNLLTGFLKPTAGTIRYKGQDVTRRNPEWLVRHGITRSFQVSAVFDSLTVRDNIVLALKKDSDPSYHWWVSRKVFERFHEEAEAVLEMVNLVEQADELAGNLPYGRRRALELATAIAARPALLLLDEPTQGMSYEEIGHITRLISRLARDRTVLMVEHNMSVIKEIADRVSVLQAGKLLTTGSYEEVSSNPLVIAAYLGGQGAATPAQQEQHV